jgi:hypothetical protein
MCISQYDIGDDKTTIITIEGHPVRVADCSLGTVLDHINPAHLILRTNTWGHKVYIPLAIAREENQ